MLQDKLMNLDKKQRDPVMERFDRIEQLLLNGRKAKNGSAELLSSFMLDWLENKRETNIQLKTYESYEGRYRNHIKPFFQGGTLAELDVKKMYDFVAYLSDKPSISPRTRQDIFRVLSNALNDAVRQEKLEKNPCECVKLPSVQKKQKAAITIDEMKKLLEVTKDHHQWIAVPLLFALGIRRGELLALTWDDVHYDIKTDTAFITVNKTVSSTKQACINDRTKTQNGNRDVCIDNALYTMMMDYKHNTQKDKKTYIIAQRKFDKWVDPRNFNRTFKEWIDKAGIRHEISPHSFRHAYATYMVLKGVPLEIIMKQAGWGDTKMIHYYTDDLIMKGQQPIAAKAMGEVMQALF